MFWTGVKYESIFIEYPKCSTCQKAKKWLVENNIEFEDRNIVLDNPSFEELKKWISMSNIPINKFFNTSGMLYRNMGLSKKLQDLNDDEKIKLLASDGMLIKRPLLIYNTGVLVGFKEDNWNILIKEQ